MLGKRQKTKVKRQKVKVNHLQLMRIASSQAPRNDICFLLVDFLE
jgi:hypothetical protein